MAKSENQKLKLLYLKDFFRQSTDEEHPASINDIVSFLASKGIHSERKSIYSDILYLQEYGLEILYRRSKPSGYYVAERDFELSEIKFLIDAVLSSRFLSPSQSAALIRKLASLSNTHEAALLRRQIVLAGRVKSSAESGFENIDILHEAIEKNSSITFRYFDWGVDCRKHFRAGTYTASPYALLWDDENYYLIAHSERHGLTHYRVDKMEEISLTHEPRVFTEESKNFNPSSYSREVFGMYRGEHETVRLRFENSLAGVVVDRFGRDIMLIPDGKDHFTFTARVAVSPNFLGWLAGFGGRAAITHPESAVALYREFCQAALAALDQ